MFATAVGLRYRAPDTGRFRALRMGKFRKGGGFNYPLSTVGFNYTDKPFYR